MKKETNYLKIKWGSFFLTFFLLGIGISAALFLVPQEKPSEQPTPSLQAPQLNNDGHYTNEDFSLLMQDNLSELDIIDNLTFEGLDEGNFRISGILSEPSRLAALCNELAPFSSILNSLKNQEISINGHLGENENGYGQFISDTITFSGYTIPAGIATKYIDQYTGLNDLLEVPIREIEINRSGIQFNNELPAAIQIASYKQQAPSPSATEKQEE